MTIRARIIFAFLLVVMLVFGLLTYRLIEDSRQYYLVSVEDTMIDTSWLLAGIVAKDLQEKSVDADSIGVDLLRNTFDNASKANLQAKIYELEKNRIYLNAYITDRNGLVIFDSAGHFTGEDFSTKTDVAKTLLGEYGARTSRRDEADPETSAMFVAAPILNNGETVGVLTVYKPSGTVRFFKKMAMSNILHVALLGVLMVFFLLLAVTLWVTEPIRKLTIYAGELAEGKRPPMPKLGSSDIGELGKAFGKMKEAIEGKRYVEKYVQDLTHEFKSPLAAIIGAVEVISTNPPPAARERFISNIYKETKRLQIMVSRLLDLSSVEAKDEIEKPENIIMDELISSIVESHKSVISNREMEILTELDESINISGESFLLSQAVTNLLSNAIDFSPERGKITIRLFPNDGNCVLTVEDEGPGIPEYAKDRIFQRFYSLPRPDTNQKSSGIGLSFVLSVVKLHKGSIELRNRPNNGCVATMRLPLLNK